MDYLHPEPLGIMPTSEIAEAQQVSSLGAHLAATLSLLFCHSEEDREEGLTHS